MMQDQDCPSCRCELYDHTIYLNLTLAEQDDKFMLRMPPVPALLTEV